MVVDCTIKLADNIKNQEKYKDLKFPNKVLDTITEKSKIHALDEKSVFVVVSLIHSNMNDSGEIRPKLLLIVKPHSNAV